MAPIAGFDNARAKLESGEAIAYRDEGTGKHVLLLLHGLGAHSGTWRKNTPRLSLGRRLVAPSLEPSRSPLSEIADRYTSQVLKLLSFLKIARTAIAGNSMGGWIAMKLALIEPSLVSSLILEDTAGLSASEPAGILSRLNETRIPTLVVWGANDAVIPSSTAQLIRSSLESSRLVIIDGGGHVPHWERPQAFNEAVLSFLEGMDRRQDGWNASPGK